MSQWWSVNKGQNFPFNWNRWRARRPITGSLGISSFLAYCFPWLLPITFGYPPSDMVSILTWAGWFTFVQLYLIKTINVNYWHFWSVALISISPLPYPLNRYSEVSNFRNKVFMLRGMWATSVDHSLPETASNTFKEESSYFLLNCIYKKTKLLIRHRVTQALRFSVFSFSLHQNS